MLGLHLQSHKKQQGNTLQVPKSLLSSPTPLTHIFFIIIVSKHEYSFKKSITLLQKKNSWIIFFKDKQHSTTKKAKDDCICDIEICLYQDVWAHHCCILIRQGETNSPSKARLNQLLDTGLGKAHLSITKNAGDIVLCSALEDNFPKLKGAGRFEVFCVEEGETHKANCLLSTLVHLQI